MSEGRIVGVVSWFDKRRGYGFLTPAQSKTDVFIHFSEIDGIGYKTLEKSQVVEFSLGFRNGKIVAQEVKVLPSGKGAANESQR